MCDKRKLAERRRETGGGWVIQVILINLSINGLVFGELFHVTGTGGEGEEEGCGGGTLCRSLREAIPLTSPGDTILLDASTPGGLHDVCDVHGVSIRHGLTLTSYNGRARLGCDSETSEMLLLVVNQSDPDEKHQTVLDNLAFQGGTILITGGHLVVRNSTFTNVAFSSRDCARATLNMASLYLDRTATWTAPFGNLLDSSVSCANLTATVTDSRFYDLKFHFKGTRYNHVTISNSIFSKKLQIESDIGGINVTLPYSFGYFLVTDCIFEKQVHFDPVHSSINIESSALRIEARDFLSSRGGVPGPTRTMRVLRPPDSNATVVIRNCVFRNNERAISVSRRFKDIRLHNCVFDTNVAMHAAAGLRLAMDYDIVMRVTDCVFRNNAAGFNTHAEIPGQFEFNGEEVQISNGPINGVISLVGKGGAVRVHKGHASFYNCTFVNNTARLLGGSIFVDRKSRATVEMSRFENTGQSWMHSMQGDVLYSSGSIQFRDVSVEVVAAHDHVSILRHGGDYWSMDVESMWFRCPLGHRLVMMNTTSHKIERETGLMRSHKLDQLYYYCQTCGSNQYSVDQGYLNYTVTEANAEYYTLMINGEEPFQSHPVSFRFGNITCRDCPYGARCEGKLHVIANFWGYAHAGRIVFQHCPPHYCCGAPTCPSHDACAAHRAGRLCGRCEAGYTEALFSSACIPDTWCTSRWVVPLLAGMGLLYCLFLLYQKDMRDFIATWALEWKLLLCCLQKRAYTVSFTQRSQHDVSDDDEHDDMNDVNDDEYHMTTTTPRKLSSQHDVPKSTSNISESNGGNVMTSPLKEVRHHTAHKPEAGFLIILFYYFQDALLLHIDTVYTETSSRFEQQMKEFLVGLFRFRLDFFQFLEDVCLYPGLQPVPKCLIKTLFVPYVVVFFGVSYLGFTLYSRLRMRGGSSCDVTSHFLSRLSGGFILAMLFTYQKLATTTFTLLNCVPVGEVSVLFIDGTNECFQGWQYIVMGYAFTCVLPFSVILMVGPPLLKQQRISLAQFFFGCLCPLPALLYYLYIHVREIPTRWPSTDASHTVMHVLQGPFKDSGSKRFVTQLCWAGVLVGRRLVLFLCYTFINDVLIRLLCMMGVCFVILMHHMYVRPYKTGTGNLAGAFSAGALLVVGAINLMRAAFEAAEYTPAGPYRVLMEACEEIENTLVLWLPLAGVCLILLTVLARLCQILVLRFCGAAGDDVEVGHPVNTTANHQAER